MPRLSWPRSARLSLRRDFLTVRANGRSIRTGFLRWFVLPDEEAARIGIRIPKQNGIAVRRNRLRRILRESLRTHRARFPGGRYLVMVNVPKEVPDRELTPAIRRDVKMLLQRIAPPREGA